MAKDFYKQAWWRLTPDENGSYVNGTWSQAPLIPYFYNPLYFDSAVLPDGRDARRSGEWLIYGTAHLSETTQGAIYDPKTDRWRDLAPPAGWSQIGDAPSAILPDGRFMIGTCCTRQEAILDPKTLTWTLTAKSGAPFGTEQGWTLLPDGTLLTVYVQQAEPLTLTKPSRSFAPPDRRDACPYVPNYTRLTHQGM